MFVQADFLSGEHLEAKRQLRTGLVANPHLTSSYVRKLPSGLGTRQRLESISKTAAVSSLARRLVSTNCHRSCRPSVFSSISTPYPRWTELWPENGYCRRLGDNLVSPPMSPKSVSLVTDSGTSERRPRDRPLLHIQGGYSDSRASLKTWNGFPRSPVPGWGTRVPNFQTTANRGCPPLSRCTQSEVPRCLSQGDGYLENISQPISK